MKRKWQLALAVLAVGAALALGPAGCEGDSLYEGVVIVPASIELRVGQSQVFRATGGQSYEWSFEPADGRLGLNSAVGDAVVATALSSAAGEGSTNSVIALTCRSVIAGVTDGATSQVENAATAYISIR